MIMMLYYSSVLYGRPWIYTAPSVLHAQKPICMYAVQYNFDACVHYQSTLSTPSLPSLPLLPTSPFPLPSFPLTPLSPPLFCSPDHISECGLVSWSGWCHRDQCWLPCQCRHTWRQQVTLNSFLNIHEHTRNGAWMTAMLFPCVHDRAHTSYNV